MNIENSEYSRELEVALEAAKEAGKIIDSYAEEVESWKKDDGSVVTEADIESQEKIVEIIREKFPEDGFHGEEEHLDPDGEDRVWVIDPIDGTFNFESGFGIYCVSIAMEINGEVKVGVVHSPETSMNTTYYGIRNEGCFIEGEQAEKEMNASDHDSIQDSNFFTTCFNIYEGELDWELEVLEKLASRGGTQRQFGSGALEMCFVADGRGDFLIDPIMKPMDYKAAKLLIEEAGGRVDVMESPFPDSELVFASNGEIHEKVKKAVGEKIIG